MFKIKKITLVNEISPIIKNIELLKEFGIPGLPFSDNSKISYRRHRYSVAAVVTHFTEHTIVYLWNTDSVKWEVLRYIK